MPNDERNGSAHNSNAHHTKNEGQKGSTPSHPHHQGQSRSSHKIQGTSNSSHSNNVLSSMVLAERVSEVASELIDQVLEKYQQRRDGLNGHGHETNELDKQNVNELTIPDLLALADCSDCVWDKNYHPCLLNGPEDNERCKEEMRKQGFDIPLSQSKSDLGYQPGHFYALKPDSKIDLDKTFDPTEVTKSPSKHEHELAPIKFAPSVEAIHQTQVKNESITDICRSRSNSAGRNKSGTNVSSKPGISKSTESKSPSKSKLHDSKGPSKRPSKNPSKPPSKPIMHKETSSKNMRKSDLKGKRSYASSTHAHVQFKKDPKATSSTKAADHSNHPPLSKKTSSHTKINSHNGSKHKVEVDNSLEYIHKLHPHASSHAEEIARENLVPLPFELPKREDSHPNLGGKCSSSHQRLHDKDSRFVPEKPTSVHKPPSTIDKKDVVCGTDKPCNMVTSSTNKEIERDSDGTVTELYSLANGKTCNWNKNYHPCSNKYNQKDKELCKKWKEDNGITGCQTRSNKTITSKSQGNNAPQTESKTRSQSQTKENGPRSSKSSRSNSKNSK
ncbi:unnamed protein product [Orchesella dallaii]|uniref:Uncharacterized protein n=1 Tax=Orchesella dallaii TaxID=48710 RepID=A0ABP1R6T7_9HEXA